MTFGSAPPLLSALITFLLGVFVYGRRSGLRAAQAFVFLSGLLVLWNLNFFFLYAVSNQDLAFKLTRWCRVAITFVSPAVVYFVLSLRTQRSRLSWWLLAIDFGVCGGLALAVALDLVVTDLRPATFGYVSVAGPFYNWFSASVIGNFAAAAAVLLYDYQTAVDPRARIQLKFLCLGAAVALPLGLTNLLPTYGIPFYPLGSFGNTAWAAIVAYAIVRHRLLDIDIVVTKGAAYAMVAVALVAPAFGTSIALQQRSFGQIHSDFSFALLTLFFVVGALFPVLRQKAEERIERSFFKGKLEYRASLGAFARSIVTILDRERLVSALLETVSQTMSLDRAAIFLNRADGIEMVRHSGPPPADTLFELPHPLIPFLSRRRVVLRDEVDRRTASELVDVLERNSWEVCVSFSGSSGLIGFMGLGRKRTLETFSIGDLNILEVLGAEASIALENARLYEELKRSQEIVQRADRLSALGTLAAGIAHEVRNPLVSIQTFFQLAPERINDEEFLTSFLPMAAGEVTRITNLINELLSFARSPSRALRVVNVSDAVERVATLLEPEARSRKVRLDRDYCRDPLLVRADPDQLKQVILNLALNALQATPYESVVTLATTGASRQGVKCARIEITDEGPGIPSDQLEHVFVPFFTTKEKGTGLGLAIAQQIVREHGGLISVQNVSHRGARFAIDLPCVEADSLLGGEIRAYNS